MCGIHTFFVSGRSQAASFDGDFSPYGVAPSTWRRQMAGRWRVNQILVFICRLLEAQRVLPQLLALAKSERKPKILYFEGLDGVRQALYYTINALEGKEITVFAGKAETASKELFALFDEWNEDMKRLRIRIRGVVPQHQSVTKYRKTDKDFGRNIKVITPGEYNADISIEVSEVFVRIVAFRELQAIIIENKDIANALRQIFEMIWKAK